MRSGSKQQIQDLLELTSEATTGTLKLFSAKMRSLAKNLFEIRSHISIHPKDFKSGVLSQLNLVIKSDAFADKCTNLANI